MSFMPNAFDPYRDALVIETQTVWPSGVAVPQDAAERQQIERQLHVDPAHVAELEYVRLPAGFVQKITVTATDISRVRETH